MNYSTKNYVRGALTAGGDIHIGDISYAQAEPPNIEALVTLINRDVQDVEILSNCPDQGIISLVIHAHENQHPELYVNRLAYYRIGNLLKINKQSAQVICYDFPLNFESDQEVENKIFNTLLPRYYHREVPGKNILDSLRSNQAGATIFYTTIPCSPSVDINSKILTTHTRFWQNQPDLGPKRPLVAIISFLYPKVEGFWGSWLKNGLCTKMRTGILALKSSLTETVVLSELENIEKSDVDKWFYDPDFTAHNPIRPFEITLKESFNQLFKNSKSLPMSKIVSHANNIVSRNIK